MILDTLNNAKRYEKLSPRLKKAFEFLLKTDLKALPLGKTVIDGTDIYATVSDYQTKPCSEAKLEAHRNYIDIQMVLSGDELIGYAPFADQPCVVPYDPARDIGFYAIGTAPYIPFGQGQFVVFFPNDAHAPGRTAGAPKPVRKLVVKVLA